MKTLVRWLGLIITLCLVARSGSAQTPAAAAVTTITQPASSPLVRKPLVIYYPALALRLGMTAVVWVRCAAAPDGTVTTTEQDRLDSLAIHQTDSAELTKYAAKAQAELVAASVTRVKQMQFVPTATPQTYLVRVPYGGFIWQPTPLRPRMRRASHERPRK